MIESHNELLAFGNKLAHTKSDYQNLLPKLPVSIVSKYDWATNSDLALRASEADRAVLPEADRI